MLVNSRQLSIITIRDHWIPNQWSLMVACRSCPPTVTGKERLSHFCHVEFQLWTCITYLTYLEMITYLILSTLAFGSGLHRERHGNVKTVMAIASTAKTYLTYLTIPANIHVLHHKLNILLDIMLPWCVKYSWNFTTTCPTEWRLVSYQIWPSRPGANLHLWNVLYSLHDAWNTIFKVFGIFSHGFHGRNSRCWCG